MIKAIIFDCFGVLTDGKQALHKNQNLFDYITQLSGKYKIAILSNAGSNWIRDEFLSADDQKLFSAIVLSRDTAYIKPDQEMFELVCQKLTVEPAEAIMVDDQQYNLDGAKAAGLNGVLYTNFVQFKEQLQRLLADSDN